MKYLCGLVLICLVQFTPSVYAAETQVEIVPATNLQNIPEAELNEAERVAKKDAMDDSREVFYLGSYQDYFAKIEFDRGLFDEAARMPAVPVTSHLIIDVRKLAQNRFNGNPGDLAGILACRADLLDSKLLRDKKIHVPWKGTLPFSTVMAWQNIQHIIEDAGHEWIYTPPVGIADITFRLPSQLVLESNTENPTLEDGILVMRIAHDLVRLGSIDAPVLVHLTCSYYSDPDEETVPVQTVSILSSLNLLNPYRAPESIIKKLEEARRSNRDSLRFGVYIHKPSMQLD